MNSIKILALVVLYKHTLEESLTWKTLHQFSDDSTIWAVYNNGPDPVDCPTNVLYCENLSNGGLSKAYDWGLQMAQQHNCSHVTILDQDTAFPITFFGTVQNEILQTRSSCILPTVISKNGFKMSPSRWFLQRGWESKSSKIPKSYSFIGSGTTISTPLFRAIWDESVMELFLEHIDHYLSYKMRKFNIVPTLIPLTLQQDYSAESTDRETIRIRHEIWKKDVLTFAKLVHCEHIMRFWVLYITIKRILKSRDPFLFR